MSSLSSGVVEYSAICIPTVGANRFSYIENKFNRIQITSDLCLPALGVRSILYAHIVQYSAVQLINI